MAFFPRRTSNPQSSSRRVASRPQGINKTPSTNNRRRSSRLLEKVAQQHFNQQSRTSSQQPPSISKATKRDHDQIEDEAVNNLPIKRAKRPRNPVIRQEEETITAQEDPVEHWRIHGTWPQELFERHPMDRVYRKVARKRSEISLKRSVDGITVSSKITESKTREEKSAPYRDFRYEEQLVDQGFYMYDHDLGPDKSSISTYQQLMREKQSTPKESLFDDEHFASTCQDIQGKNEARVIFDIRGLIVPSANPLFPQGKKTLMESVDEGWNQSWPITSTRPQPDYSVGYRREAFTQEQLDKIRPELGDSSAMLSIFRATSYMYFPFLTCEVKCGAVALDIADRQNAHSAGIATRAIYELFRLAKREAEVDRKILAFSISHDDKSVRIYGHYPVILQDQVTYHRHSIDLIGFQVQGGKQRWTSYKFVKSIYKIWAPAHLEQIRSVLDELPDAASSTGLATAAANAEPTSEHTDLSQQVAGSHIYTDEAQSMHEPEIVTPDPGNQLQTPDTSVSVVQTRKKQKGTAKKNTSSPKQG